jgi:Transposase DDE domain group 1
MVLAIAMNTKAITPSTGKVRRDVVGGQRGQGNEWNGRVRRADARRITISGTKERLSSNAGLVRFGSFTRQLGVPAELRRRFRRLKKGPQVVYPMEVQLQTLLDAHVAGESRVFGIESLAADPLFVRLAGGTVPSVDTLYRDLRRFDDEAIASLEELIACHGLDRDALRRHREVHLDIDTSVLSLTGDHQGGELGYNPRNHSRPSYHPILSRCAELDTCVGAYLRPGNTGFGAEDASTVGRIVRRMKSRLTAKQNLYVRIDAASDCTALLSSIVAEQAFFVVKARLTAGLRDAVAATTRWTTVDRDALDAPVTQVAEVVFARDEWIKAGLQVRVVALRTKESRAGKQVYLWPDEEYTVKVYLTNSDEDAADVARRYEGRAGVEPLIAEWKNGWGIGDMPCWGFNANHAALLVKLLAHNLLRRFARAVAPRLARARWRVEWIRRALINVAGKLVKTGRRWTLAVPEKSELLCASRE